MAEGARLESVCRSQAYRGFESLPLYKTKSLTIDYLIVKDFCFLFSLHVAYICSDSLIIVFSKMGRFGNIISL